MPHRLVPFRSVENFRDLGGYSTRCGRTVRRGRLYRSDAPFGLAEPGPAGPGLAERGPASPGLADRGPSLAEILAGDGPRFAALGIRTVIDLRRPDELIAFGRLPEGLGLRFHNIDLDPVPWPMIDPAAEEMPTYLSSQYLRLAEAGVRGDNPIGQALTLLAQEEHSPVLFHCAAGKDRTGVLAALTLALLGVCDDDIADDYALSRLAQRRQRAWLREAAARGVAAPGWLRNPAPPAAILLFLAALRRRYGSIERYAAQGGVSAGVLDGLRSHLLGDEPVPAGPSPA